MSVVAGDRQEGDKEDVILIQEEDTNQKLKKNSGASSVAKYPGLVLSVGIIIFITTVLVWSIGYIPYYQEAGPLFWVLVGLLLIFHGLIGFCKTPESFILDINVNGKQLSHSIPLRLVLVSVANTCIGIAGAISMSLIFKSVWSTLGLILSILLLLWVLVSIFLKQKLTNISQVLQQPRTVTYKPVHILLLVLATVTCVVMFSAQVLLIAIRECDREHGPIVFQKAEEFTIRRNNLLGVLPFIGKQFVISFQLLITGATVGEFESIIHFTTEGDYQNLGDRTPALWLTKGTRLYVGSAIDRVPDYMMESYLTLSLNTWHNIEISQLMLESQVFFDLKVDGTGYAGITNFAPSEFSAVKMFAGDPWYMPAKGRIRNLEVNTETVEMKKKIPIVFKSVEEFKLGKNYVRGNLRFIGQQFIISFQMKLNSGVPEWRNALYFTTNGENVFTAGNMSSVYGGSTPSIGIWSRNAGEDKYLLGVFSAIDGNPHYWTYKDVPRLTYGVWYNIEVSQLWIDNKFVFEAKFEKAKASRDGWINFGNGTSMWSIVNNDARMFENVNIMGSVGDPADANVRNIVVKTKLGNY